MSFQILSSGAANDGEIGLGFAFGEGNRKLNAQLELRRQYLFDERIDEANRSCMRGILRHFRYDPSFQEFHSILGTEDPLRRHAMILLDGKLVGGINRLSGHTHI